MAIQEIVLSPVQVQVAVDSPAKPRVTLVGLAVPGEHMFEEMVVG